MDGFGHLAKLLIIMGLCLVGGGCLLLALGRLGVPSWRPLPGDIVIKRGTWGFYLPVVTCLLISLLLTLFFQIVHWLRR